MAPLRRFPKRSSFAALLLPALALAALQIPAGTEIQIRLKDKLSSATAKVNDAVETVVVSPVMVDGQFVIPAGALMHGKVEKVTQSSKGDERSILLLSFTGIEFDGKKLTCAARVSAVDNARETVDDQGQINGILASETITGRLDAGIAKVADKYAEFADILNTAKKAILKPAESGIAYDAGVDLTAKLTAPLIVAGPSSPGPAAQLRPVSDEAGLAKLVDGEPFQTIAQDPPKPSDITNLLLIGSEDEVRQTFTAAGWSVASGLTTEAKFETFKALAENRGYKEAPVSILMLDGKAPDIVFEELNNTFSSRHHLRVWRRPSTFQGQPVWSVAATHDTGISFSEENRTFIHKIDPQIDRERAKVVNDLLFTGKVQSVELVERPKVPQHGQNATGDNLETDGRIAVLVLK
jgi:LssY C-terminus